MSDSVYKFIDLVGSSSESWEKASKTAIERAAKSIRGLRVAEVIEQDVQIGEKNALKYRVKLRVSFKMD